MESSVLEAAAVATCKEVFLLLNSLKEVMIVSHHVRLLNPACALYIQLYEHDEFKEYLSHDPFRAVTCTSARARRSRAAWPA